MVTIASVISINENTNFNGQQEIDPAGIVYIRPNPADSTQTLLYEEQLGSQLPRRWVIDDSVNNIIANTNADTGYDVLVEGTLVSFMEETEFAGEVWATNPQRIFQMRDNADDEAIIRLNAGNVQGLFEFVFDRTSAAYMADANTTITQVESGVVDRINEMELGADETIYWSTRLVEKVIPARNAGYGDNSTPQIVQVRTFENKRIDYSIAVASSS